MQLTAAEVRVVQLRKLVHYDSLRSARKLERALQALDGRDVPDAETQGLLGGVESSPPSWTVQPSALSPRAAAASPAVAAIPTAVAAQSVSVAAEGDEEWKLQAGTELAEVVEVVEVSGAEVQRLGPRRTSSEKEAALRRAGR